MIDGIGSAVFGIRFTFQYGSTLISSVGYLKDVEILFTFQYGSTLIMNWFSIL